MIRTSAARSRVEPTRRKRPLFKKVQQLDLHGRGQIADFVEKEGRAVCRFDEAALHGRRAGECAALVAEELGLEQRFGQSAAVDGDERGVGTLAACMNETREHVFARARFARDDDGRIEPRRRLGNRDESAHRLAGVDERRRAFFSRRAARAMRHRSQRSVLPDEPPLLLSLANDRFHLVERGRFGEIVVSAESHRFDPGAERSVRREHDHFGRIVELSDLAQGVEAGHAGHADVEHNDIVVRRPQRFESIFARSRRRHCKA
jgi:hypothetical protein